MAKEKLSEAQEYEVLIGASLSEPHIDEFAVNFPYIYLFISLRGATALLVAAMQPVATRWVVI